MTSVETTDSLQAKIVTLCGQILTSSLNQIHALVGTHSKLNSFKKYPEFKKEGYIDEKLVMIRNQMIKNNARDHMELLHALEGFKKPTGDAMEVNRMNQDIDKISAELRKNYETKNISCQELFVKIE